MAMTDVPRCLVCGSLHWYGWPHEWPAKAATPSSTYRYRDPEARRKYQRDLMRQRRQKHE